MDTTRRGFMAASTALAGALVAPANAARNGDDTVWKPNWELAELMKQRRLSPVELTIMVLHRIERLDPYVHAYITVDREGALAQARVAEAAIMAGEPIGPLHGLPISVKDLALTKGLRTTEGSLIFADRIPDQDEIFVERLRKAGAIIVGKTNTPEFGSFGRTINRVAGETRNPWDLTRITGASSGGSAAAAACGMPTLAVASDGGGSTRIPAHYNGVFGMQPSAGRLPMLSPAIGGPPQASFGPTTIDVLDNAMLLNVLAGPDPRDPSAIHSPRPDFTQHLQAGIEGFKIAWSDDFGHIPILDRRVLDLQRSSALLLEQAGAVVEQPQIQLYDFFDAWRTTISALGRVSRVQSFSEEDRTKLSPPIASLFLQELKPPTSEELAAAEQIRADIRRRFDELFARYDLICSPVLTTTAPIAPEGWAQPYDDAVYAKEFGTPYTHVANFLGLAAASVPCGFVDGLPVGLHVIADRLNEEKVYRAAQAFSAIKPWNERHPEIAEA